MTNDTLPGDYIAGFVDGEGCFALKYAKDRKRGKEYFYWKAEFVIVLRIDDIDLLGSIQRSFGCGTVISSNNNTQARFSVQKLSEISSKILPFFERHRLYGKKYKDFILWARAVRILQNNNNMGINAEKGKRGFVKKEMKESDQQDLKKIREEMLEYKAKRGKSFRWQ